MAPGRFCELKRKTRCQSRRRRPRRGQPLFSYETEIRQGKPAEIREYRGQVVRIDAEPGRQGGEILIDGRGGNPATGAGIVRTVDDLHGKLAVGPLPVHCPAQDQVMAAPAVITALAVARESATEITARKAGDTIREAELFHCAL